MRMNMTERRSSATYARAFASRTLSAGRVISKILNHHRLTNCELQRVVFEFNHDVIEVRLAAFWTREVLDVVEDGQTRNAIQYSKMVAPMPEVLRLALTRKRHLLPIL